MWPAFRAGLDQQVLTGGAEETRTCSSFFRRISSTFRWLLEWMLLTKVGLQAGRYSGSKRPDLKRTPHALQSVFAP
ncbi:hypothetical protein IEQ34_014180 [Dendrobium chrysotoxum]|uniref:Uncharacterized protein n=1 Tax=Dendrobium chrysotoxum TaxID=161865 RepID=A0AAV7GLB1_DENCH|nr:hypothetical protein IEQ34_014180 [Dendrobium chrysotoxum]